MLTHHMSINSINGNYWGADEQVWGDCGAGNGNRTITLGDSDFIRNCILFRIM